MKITSITGSNHFQITLDDKRDFEIVPVFDYASQTIKYQSATGGNNITQYNDLPSDVINLLNAILPGTDFLKIANGLFPGIGQGGGGGGPEAPDSSSVTVVVSPVPGQGDFTTIQAAVNALPAEGGVVALREGVYSLTTTVLIPDKSIIFRGCSNATVVDLGSHTIAGFTIPPVMTLGRKISFQDFIMRGNSTTGQTMFAYQDGNSNSWFQATRVHVTDSSIETIIDLQNFDQAFTRSLKIQLNECAIFPTALATSTLIKCVIPAGTQTASVSVAWNNCILRNLQDFSIFGDFWSINAGIDVVFSYTSIAFKAGCAVNGFHTSDSDIFIRGGDFSIFGATSFLPDAVLDCLIFGLDFNTGLPSRLIFKGNFQGMSFDSSIISVTTVRVETGADPVFVTGCYFPGSGTAATGIDIEDRPLTNIAGCEFGDPFGGHTTQAILLNNTPNCVITGCGFNEAGATKTIVETGTTDRTMVAGCGGISNGAGFVKIGPNSLIAAGVVNIA